MKLSDAAIYISRGISPAYDDDGVVVLNQKCIRDNKVSFGPSRITNPSKKRISDDKYVKQYDVLVNSTGVGTLGRVAQIKSLDKPLTVDSHITIVRPNLDKFDPYYFGYAMYYVQDQIERMGDGATGQTELSRTRLAAEIEVPDLPINQQVRIGETLSRYDKLIENNSKRIEKLEAMARLLYLEMFTGAVSDKWPRKNVKELIIRISPGKLYAQKNVLNEGSVPVFDQGRSGIIGYHNDEPGIIASYDEPVITFANHTCYQRLVFHPFSAIQNVLPFMPSNQHDIYWLYYATRDLVKLNDYKGHWPEFMSKRVVVPEERLSIEFGEKVKPLLILIDKLEQKNNKLAKARDLLLPRMMSGEIKP